jgi:hypothetical protein
VTSFLKKVIPLDKNSKKETRSIAGIVKVVKYKEETILWLKVFRVPSLDT